MPAIRLLCSALMLTALAGCGIKGPLYLPDDRAATDEKAVQMPADDNKPRQETTR